MGAAGPYGVKHKDDFLGLKICANLEKKLKISALSIGPYPEVEPTTSSSSTTTLLTTTKLDDFGTCETNFTDAVFHCHEAVLKES